MKIKRESLIYFMLIIVAINLIIININTISQSKQLKSMGYRNNMGYRYYIGEIDRIQMDKGITSVEISPTISNREFISEIKSNHQVEYHADMINITGIRDPSIPKFKRLKIGDLRKMAMNLKVGDKFIFKLKNDVKDDNEYNLQIEGLAFDTTLKKYGSVMRMDGYMLVRNISFEARPWNIA